MMDWWIVVWFEPITTFSTLPITAEQTTLDTAVQTETNSMLSTAVKLL
jgi:hypothetical protein